MSLDVDEGSTVTDFLPTERARGITIQSAAITFNWPPLPKQRSEGNEAKHPQRKSLIPHAINLIDTPGHADFTFEVVRSLRVLDGAICILDGIAGVEAQTEKVWQQARRYQIPIIAYVNKLDREGASFGKTVKEIGGRLLSWPAVCQIPWWDGGNGPFVGVGDVIGLRGLRWEVGGDGKKVHAFDLEELQHVDMKLAQEIKRARIALVELLSTHDTKLVDIFLECGDNHLAIPATDIVHSLRRCLLNGPQKIVPVFAGSSLKNIGVQPLLDAVVDLLPSPTGRPDPEISGSTKLQLKDLIGVSASGKPGPQDKTSRAVRFAATLETCALAFKVVNDARRGVLVYVRVYAGTLNRNAVLFNTNLQIFERAQRPLKMYASDAVEVSCIPTGQIGVIAGLQHARTGDTLISYAGIGMKKTPPTELSQLQLSPIEIPPPVFFASIEPRSPSEEKLVQESLALLLREDPSLAMSPEAESGQMLLSGMGELHLEIARDRLVKEFRTKAEMGSIEIGYKECLIDGSEPVVYLHEKEIAGKKGKAGCEAQVRPVRDSLDQDQLDNDSSATSRTVKKDGNVISIHIQGNDESDKGTDFARTVLPSHLTLPALQSSLISGVLGALVRGPNHALPMHSTHVIINCLPSRDLFGSESTPAALTAAARRATHDSLGNAARKSGRTALMEPVMNVTISVDEANLGGVSQDISGARGGHVLSLDDDDSSSTAASANEDKTQDIKIAEIYYPLDPYETGSSSGLINSQGLMTARPRTITARVPLKEMVGYDKHLRSLSGGRGTFLMSVDRYEKMSTQREKILWEGRRAWAS
ncbi:MAG: Ribosome-releasing factor 2, mitochondrial [Peltula sp. TS41687]|nr:MAG: Ribosome-releasing factor 2, mitochondrial [Peltula sp. TS41687]